MNIFCGLCYNRKSLKTPAFAINLRTFLRGGHFQCLKCLKQENCYIPLDQSFKVKPVDDNSPIVYPNSFCGNIQVNSRLIDSNELQNQIESIYKYKIHNKLKDIQNLIGNNFTKCYDELGNQFQGILMTFKKDVTATFAQKTIELEKYKRSQIFNLKQNQIQNEQERINSLESQLAQMRDRLMYAGKHEYSNIGILMQCVKQLTHELNGMLIQFEKKVKQQFAKITRKINKTSIQQLYLGKMSMSSQKIRDCSKVHFQTKIYPPWQKFSLFIQPSQTQQWDWRTALSKFKRKEGLRSSKEYPIKLESEDQNYQQGNFQIKKKVPTELMFDTCKQAYQPTVEFLKKFKKLRKISIPHLKKESILRIIQTYKTLQYFDVWNGSGMDEQCLQLLVLNNSGLKNIYYGQNVHGNIQKVQEMKSFSVQRQVIEQNPLRMEIYLFAIKQLENIWINDFSRCHQILHLPLKHLAIGNRKLKLDMKQCPLSIMKFNQLLSLALKGLKIDDKLFQNMLSHNKMLETLVIEDCISYSKASMNVVSQLQHLKELVIRNCALPLFPFPSILTLEVLVLERCRYNLMANAPSLKYLNLNSTFITQPIIQTIKGYPCLQSLSLARCVAKSVTLNLSQIVNLDISYMDLKQVTLKQCTSVVKLNVQRCMRCPRLDILLDTYPMVSSINIIGWLVYNVQIQRVIKGIIKDIIVSDIQYYYEIKANTINVVLKQ